MNRIVEILNGINYLIESLTPLQRWQSARKMSGGGGLDERFVAVCLVVLLVLTVLLVVINRFGRKMENAGSVRDAFEEIGKNKGLSRSEIHLMRLIAESMPLTDPEMLFAMPEAFNKGSRKVLQGLIAAGKKEEVSRLNSELSFIKEKLGFVKRAPKNSIDISQNDLSSRQISVGTKVFITARMSAERQNEIAGEVVGNNEAGLAVTVDKQLDNTDGEYMQVRYFFGAGLWEFEASCLSNDARTVILSHSEEVRFVNRRRFLRVDVKMPALAAEFKFSDKRKTNPFSTGPIQQDISEQAIRDYSGDIWGSPVFYPAAVTEIGGPGLRITVPFEIEKGKRIIVIFRLTAGKDAPKNDNENDTLEIIQDVAVVKDVKKVEHGYSLAVELTSTEEANIARLIQITNKACVEKEAENARKSAQAKDLKIEETVLA